MTGKRLSMAAHALRERRLVLGMKQTELAAKLGVCVTTISRLEQGHNAASPLLAAKLREVMGEEARA